MSLSTDRSEVVTQTKSTKKHWLWFFGLYCASLVTFALIMYLLRLTMTLLP